MARTPIPTDELLADLERVGDELGKPPTSYEYDEFGTYSRVTIKNRFGSWVDGLEAAGFDVTDRQGVSSFDHD